MAFMFFQILRFYIYILLCSFFFDGLDVKDCAMAWLSLMFSFFFSFS